MQNIHINNHCWKLSMCCNHTWKFTVGYKSDKFAWKNTNLLWSCCDSNIQHTQDMLCLASGSVSAAWSGLGQRSSAILSCTEACSEYPVRPYDVQVPKLWNKAIGALHWVMVQFNSTGRLFLLSPEHVFPGPNKLRIYKCHVVCLLELLSREEGGWQIHRN